jgi:hypothetical protein
LASSVAAIATVPAACASNSKLATFCAARRASPTLLSSSMT